MSIVFLNKKTGLWSPVLFAVLVGFSWQTLTALLRADNNEVENNHICCHLLWSIQPPRLTRQHFLFDFFGKRRLNAGMQSVTQTVYALTQAFFYGWFFAPARVGLSTR